MSDSEDEDFAEYGTPLEPLDEDAMPRKKQFSLEDQVVRDKQGRRRFHGAFTGGFSAGFFNSVGTLEGWTPSTFKSTRAERTSKPTQRPEDFMDEEDMEEFGIAPKVLRATKDYSERGQKRQKPVSSDGPIPGAPVLEQLLQPARDTVGVKLLRRMGWKPGQGVGPRLTKREKRLQRQNQIKAVPSQSEATVSSSSSDEERSEELTFAPGDYDMFVCRPKRDSFGIGYSGLDKRPVLSGHVNLFDGPSLVISENSRKVSIRGQAFGVGALEEEDEDIYSREDMSQYDFALDAPSSSDKPTQPCIPIRASGSNTLEGFVAAVVGKLARIACFPPPTLPLDYQPVHRPHTSHFQPATGPAPVRRHLVSADRAVIVGEEQAESCQQERQRLAEAAARLTEGLPSVSVGRFRPFAAQPDKQRRYEQFLALSKLGETARLAHLQPLSMTDWEKERERSEFEQASRLFQPLSADMSERFVPASQEDRPTDLLVPVQRADDKDAELRAAARMKMFGKLTRTREVWQPSSLVCKRFNIPDPVLGSGVITAAKKTTPKFSAFEFLVTPKVAVKEEQEEEKVEEEEEEEEEEKEDEEDEEKPSAAVGPSTLTEGASVNDAVVLPRTGKDTTVLEFPDPPQKVDLFKAIFLSSSEDSDTDADGSGEAIADSGPPPAGDNILRNTSPPRGLFANLDLDAINVIRPSVGKQNIGESAATLPDNGKPGVNDLDVVKPEGEACPQEAEMYGPRLPSCLPVPVPVPVRPTSTPNRLSLPSVVGASVVWLEKTADKHHHKKASKHKKHKKEKHKKKKKKR